MATFVSKSPPPSIINLKGAQVVKDNELKPRESQRKQDDVAVGVSLVKSIQDFVFETAFIAFVGSIFPLTILLCLRAFVFETAGVYFGDDRTLVPPILIGGGVEKNITVVPFGRERQPWR